MRLLSSLKYEILIFVFFVLIRLPDLGHDNFNTDVWKWKQRSYDFGTGVYGLQFEKTFQKYHPGVTLMWVGSTGVKVANLITSDIFPQAFPNELSKIFFLDKVQKILLVIFIAVAYSFAFYAAKNIISVRFALLTFLLVSLEPFYVGLTRVFHLEGTMSTLMLASILWLYYFFTDINKPRRLVTSAIFGGLAILTKTSAVFLIPFVGFSLVFLSGLMDLKAPIKLGNFRMPLVLGLKWVLVSVLVFVLLWPAMWVTPGKSLSGLYSGVADVGVEADHAQIYFGQLVPDPGTLYYFVVIGLRSSIWLLVGFLAAVVLYFVNRKSDPASVAWKKFFVFLFAYSLLYFIQITIPSKKLDRYILPTILSMGLVAGLFYELLLTKFAWAKYLLLSGIFLPAIITVGYLHYDYLSYYNPIFGGLKSGIYTLEPKWLIGKKEIMSYFSQLKKERGYIDAAEDKSFEELIYKKSEIDNVLTVGFQEKYYTQIWPFFRENNDWAIIMELRPFAMRTRFFVYPVWNDESQYEWRFRLKEHGKIYIRGVHAYTVYEKVV